MLGRILVGVFYAAVFFALGAWSGGHLKPVGNAMVRSAETVQSGASDLWAWALRTDTPKKDSKVVATPPVERSTTVVADLGIARSAFSHGDLKGSIATYRAYLSAHPEDADAHGELGNVYYNSGQTAEAAEEFHAAALLLIAEGRTTQARALEPAIRAEAPALADDVTRQLNEKIANAAGPPAAQPTIDRMK